MAEQRPVKLEFPNGWIVSLLPCGNGLVEAWAWTTNKGQYVDHPESPLYGITGIKAAEFIQEVMAF